MLCAAQALYLIIRGGAEVLSHTASGYLVLAMIGDHDFFGEASLVTEEKCSASVTPHTAAA